MESFPNLQRVYRTPHLQSMRSPPLHFLVMHVLLQQSRHSISFINTYFRISIMSLPSV